VRCLLDDQLVFCFRILVAVWRDFFFCRPFRVVQICHTLPGLQLALQHASPSARAALEKKIRVAEQHQRVLSFQRRAHIQEKANIAPGCAVVSMDYTKLSLPDLSMFVDLILVLDFVRDGISQRSYVDLIAISEKTNVFYIIQGMQFLFQHTSVFAPFSKLLMWSDGSSKEFKNRFVQRFFSFLSTLYGKTCEYSYFASHHGKSLCDSHAYHVKHAVTKLFLQKERALACHMAHHPDVQGCQEAEHFFDVNVDEVVAAVSTQVSNTLAFKMPTIEKNSMWKEQCTKLTGIKSMHSFKYSVSGSGSQAAATIHLAEFNDAPEKLTFTNYCRLNVGGN